MSDTISNITLPTNVWVNLYAVSRVVVGHVIAVQNIGSHDVYLSSKTTEPDIGHDAYAVIQRGTGNWMRNEFGDAGAWAFCPNTGGKLSIRKV